MQKPIWLVLDSREPGGIETHVLQLAIGLQQANQALQVVFIKDHGAHPLKAALSTHGIHHRSLDGSLLSLVKEARVTRPRVIHTHGYKAGLYGRVTGKLVSSRVVSTYHAGEPGTGPVALYDWLDRHTAWASHVSLAVSELIAQRIPGHALVMDNFIDTKALTRSGGTQVAFVGRLSKEKGPDRFLQLASQYPTQPFHIYGDGPLGQQLRCEASDNVIFHGQQADMTLIWPQIGLLVMPSRHEGLPMAALEAMGRSIPLLATQVGALPKLIQSGKNGWLVNQQNLTQLGACLQKWLSMSERTRKSIAKAAANTVHNHYSSEVAIPQLLDIYNDSRANVAT